MGDNFLLLRRGGLLERAAYSKLPCHFGCQNSGTVYPSLDLISVCMFTGAECERGLYDFKFEEGEGPYLRIFNSFQLTSSRI